MKKKNQTSRKMCTHDSWIHEWEHCHLYFSSCCQNGCCYNDQYPPRCKPCRHLHSLAKSETDDHSPLLGVHDPTLRWFPLLLATPPPPGPDLHTQAPWPLVWVSFCPLCPFCPLCTPRSASSIPHDLIFQSNPDTLSEQQTVCISACLWVISTHFSNSTNYRWNPSPPRSNFSIGEGGAPSPWLTVRVSTCP